MRPQAQARMRAGFNFQAGVFVKPRNAATALEVADQANLFTIVVYIEGEIAVAHELQQQLIAGGKVLASRVLRQGGNVGQVLWYWLVGTRHLPVHQGR